LFPFKFMYVCFYCMICAPSHISWCDQSNQNHSAILVSINLWAKQDKWLGNGYLSADYYYYPMRHVRFLIHMSRSCSRSTGSSLELRFFGCACRRWRFAINGENMVTRLSARVGLRVGAEVGVRPEDGVADGKQRRVALTDRPTLGPTERFTLIKLNQQQFYNLAH